MTHQVAARRRRLRGLLLGLVVGDAVGTAHGAVPGGAAPLRNSVGAQLACVTTEGLIRAAVRQHSKGICHPPSVVWHALVRWGYGQKIDAPRAYTQWSGMSQSWPDGWLAQLPLLRERRGSAPATVAALKAGTQATIQEPSTNSGGGHALTRALPAAALGFPPPQLHQLAADIAAHTHGSAVGYTSAAELALITAAALTEDSVAAAATSGLREVSRLDPGSHHVDVFTAAVSAAHGRPDAGRPRHFASDAGASACVAGALYAAATHPNAEDFTAAVTFAAQAPEGKVTAAVTGALLGALHGADALPVALLSRSELVWVADTLAQDLYAVLHGNPDGHETLKPTGDNALTIAWEDGTEPAWWRRYPGW